MESWEIERLMRAINTTFATAVEHGVEPFKEELTTNPEAAISAFSEYLERALSINGGMFRGLQAGGPCELITGPILDAIGWAYSRIDGTLRRKALLACLGFLDGQNYYLAQDNVMLINEPLLVGDIIFNRALYFCGYKEYSDAIAPINDWDDFAKVFINEKGELHCRSIFWLIFALARADTPGAITDEFAARFPAITIRGKYTILALGQKYSYDRNKFSRWLFQNGEPGEDYLLSL